MKPKDFLLAAFSGILLVLIFPSANVSILSWVALVPLLVCLRGKSPGNSLLLGFVAGFTGFAGILYWIVKTLVAYGGISVLVSVLLFIILVSYIALYVAIFAWGVSLFSCRFSSVLLRVFLSSCLWVSLEIMRTYALTGFPWALLGYSQWRSLAVIQVAQFTGVYGISFLIVLINAALAEIIATNCDSESSRVGFKVAAGALVVLLGVVIYGSYSLKDGGFDNDANSVNISVIQANISQDKKWDKTKQFSVIETYSRLTKQAALHGAEVTVWPETAVPGYMRYQGGLLRRVKDIARSNRIWLILGSPDFVDEKYYNAAFIISPEGEIRGSYYKMHLVPFGETVPLRKPLSRYFEVLEEMGDFTPGDEFSLLVSDKGVFAAVICFESIFPDLFRRFVKEGAQVMVNVTEDGWYGRTSAPWQHFSVNVFRAVENRVSVVRSANTGISGFIDPWGRVKKSTDIFTEDFLVGKVPIRTPGTFYSKRGDLFSYLCILITLAAIIAAIIKTEGVASS
ncbi:MAG: apolipoprotein N-acyltransferase [bacterium]